LRFTSASLYWIAQNYVQDGSDYGLKKEDAQAHHCTTAEKLTSKHASDQAES
jgi:hypothetical protein